MGNICSLRDQQRVTSACHTASEFRTAPRTTITPKIRCNLKQRLSLCSHSLTRKHRRNFDGENQRMLAAKKRSIRWQKRALSIFKRQAFLRSWCATFNAKMFALKRLSRVRMILPGLATLIPRREVENIHSSSSSSNRWIPKKKKPHHICFRKLLAKCWWEMLYLHKSYKEMVQSW